MRALSLCLPISLLCAGRAGAQTEGNRWDGSTYQHDHDRETAPGGYDGGV